MKTTTIVGFLLILILCCLAVLCASLLGIGLVARLPGGSPLPARPDVLTPAPVIRSPAAVATETLRTLIEANVPENNPSEIAVRLGAVSGPVPETVPAPASPLAIGETQSFWATNSDTDAKFRIQATLQHITEHTYFWVENGVNFDREDMLQLIDDFEANTYPVVRTFFGSEWSPGIDNDPRIYILYARNLGGNIAGYFVSADELPPLIHEYSNAHEMFFLNADNVKLDSAFASGVLSHEFQHMIHWNSDRNEETWVNEGFSEVAALLTGDYSGEADWAYAANPDIPLTIWPVDGPRVPHYGGSFLLLTYFLGRYGEAATRQLAADPANGFTAIDQVLRRLGVTDALRGAPPTGADLFQDYAVSLFLQDLSAGDGRYTFSNYPDAPEVEATETISKCPTGPQLRDVNQFGIDYIRITCPGNAALLFEGSTSIPVLTADPHSGEYAFWSNRGDEADTSLTRPFDFTAISGRLTLQYWMWYDIEKDYDYVYLLASTDGENWEILTTPGGTADDPSGNSYGWGYNGKTNGWVQESVDLSAYAGGQVWLRFEYITDAAVVGEGLLLDDMAIPEAGYFSDFELDNGGWEAEGFVRIQNVLPQTFKLSLITVRDGGNEVTYLDVGPDNRLEIPIFIGGDIQEIVLVLSGTTRFTAQKTGYEFEIAPLK